jgi:glycerol-3-phosphate dehydrogenase
LTERSRRRLVRIYGSRARAVAALVASTPALAAVIHEPSGLLAAKLVFAIDDDLAVTLTDVLARRVLLAFEPGHGLEVVEAAANVLGASAGWTAERRSAEIEGYRRWLDRLAVPAETGPRSVSFGAGVATKGR